MRIAVVGSGIAGLASAWLLSRKHHVTLFEANLLRFMANHQMLQVSDLPQWSVVRGGSEGRNSGVPAHPVRRRLLGLGVP